MIADLALVKGYSTELQQYVTAPYFLAANTGLEADDIRSEVDEARSSALGLIQWLAHEEFYSEAERLDRILAVLVAAETFDTDQEKVRRV